MVCKKNGPTLCLDDNCSTCPIRRIPQEFIDNNWISEKNDIDPRTIPKGSETRHYFKCKSCHHIDLRTVCKFVKGKQCEYCMRNGTKLCDCSCCYDKSLASVVLDKYWVTHLNEDLDPRQIRKGIQDKKYWFYCKDDTCRHIYDTTPYEFMRGKTCRYCSPHQDDLCGDDSCEGCLSRSILSYCGEKNWITKYNNDLNPRMIRRGSHSYRCAFLCRSCGHPHYNTPYVYSLSNTCRYCCLANGTVCKKMDCKICLPNRFFNHPSCKYWKYDKNEIDPRYLRMNSHTSAIFQCPECDQEYSAVIKDVNSGYWCSCTRKKTESLVLAWLKETCPNLTIIPQFSISSIPSRKFDFFIKEYNNILEIDGPQHFIQISNWQPPKDTRHIDIAKMTHAMRDGKSVIRIPQMDIWNDTSDWKDLLNKSIHSYHTSTIIYLSDTDIYTMHKKDMDRTIHRL